MDLRDGPDEAAFRAALRAWLEANVPSGLRGFRGWSGPAAVALGRDWSTRLAEAGYAGLTWPKEFGGAGKPWRYQALYLEELARAEAPQHLRVIGVGMAGPTIIAHGRPDQKARYLAKILSAEEIWCQGFSADRIRSEEHTSELQSQSNLVCRLLLEKKKIHNTEY